MTRIHPTAVIDPTASIDGGAEIGPYAVVGPSVVIGRGTVVAPHAVIERDATIGQRCYIGCGTIIGSAPQDIKYRGEHTRVEIGDDTRIREHATVNRGSAASGRTVVGPRCFIMSYAHVAHDCVLESDVTLANAVQLGGHVVLESHVNVGGMTAIHQFVRVGTWAFVGGGSRVTQDIPPYARAAGNPLRFYGINAHGLRRAGLDQPSRSSLHRAFRLLFNSDRTTTAALEEIRQKEPHPPEIVRLLAFFERSERGVLV